MQAWLPDHVGMVVGGDDVLEAAGAYGFGVEIMLARSKSGSTAALRHSIGGMCSDDELEMGQDVAEVALGRRCLQDSEDVCIFIWSASGSRSESGVVMARGGNGTKEQIASHGHAGHFGRRARSDEGGDVDGRVTGQQHV